MDTLSAIAIFNEMDGLGKYIYRNSDLRTLFSKDSDRNFIDTITRLVKKNVLVRAANGVFVYDAAKNKDSNILEDIAKNIRRGQYNYLSLESALSEYGVISQIPTGHITVMTTGRKGIFETAWGNIEFIHTERSPLEIVQRSSVLETRNIRLAMPDLALEDLKRVNRNLHLVSIEDYKEIINETAPKL